MIEVDYHYNMLHHVNEYNVFVIELNLDKPEIQSLLIFELVQIL
jgi:hypothetical protein